MDLVCGVDRSNGVDYTCITLGHKNDGGIKITKVILLTAEETRLVTDALCGLKHE